MTYLETARRFVAQYPPPGKPLMVGITGSHYYGFPSPDSDIDLKGIHVAPVDQVLGLDSPRDTHDIIQRFDRIECDLTTHEVSKALALLIKGNGNMLERLLTPYQAFESDAQAELRVLAAESISKRSWGHYRGFTNGMRREYTKGGRRVKAALYIYRSALTGIHLMNTGRLVCDLGVLSEEYGYADVVLPLIQQKRESNEKVWMNEDADKVHMANWDKLDEALDKTRETSTLPDRCPNKGALNDWLVRLRKEGF